MKIHQYALAAWSSQEVRPALNIHTPFSYQDTQKQAEEVKEKTS
jgi:hypothetical protein